MGCVCPTCASVPHVRLSHVCVCPTCASVPHVRLSHMCVCPTCASVPHVRLSHMCVCPIYESVPMHFYESYNFYTSHPRRASKRPPEAAYLLVHIRKDFM